MNLLDWLYGRLPSPESPIRGRPFFQYLAHPINKSLLSQENYAGHTLFNANLGNIGDFGSCPENFQQILKKSPIFDLIILKILQNCRLIF